MPDNKGLSTARRSCMLLVATERKHGGKREEKLRFN